MNPRFQSVISIACLIATVIVAAGQAVAANDDAKDGVEMAAPTQAGQRSTSFLKSGFHLGVFSGGGNIQGAIAYEDWLGRRSDFQVEFLTDTAYADYVKPDGTKVTDALSHVGYLTGLWSHANRPDRNMMFSVPLATKQDPSLANVAAGRYDAAFQTVAATIAKAYPEAVIRIGWEFNGGWYAWAAKGRPQEYIDAFRHVALIFKAASPQFTIDWCPTHGFSGNMQADTAYPGDDVVDVIGMDFYNDYRWGNFKEDPAARWNWLKGYDRGLEWQARFAAAHHKPMSIPEWGVNRDDAAFIEHMHDWITHHDFAYVAYWDSNSAFAGNLSKGQYPNAAETYRRLFNAPDSAL